MTNLMDKYNKILIKIHDDVKLEDYYVEVTIGGFLRLDKEELSKLAKALWDYSWEVKGNFTAENDKYFQSWYFEFPRSQVVIREVAEKLFLYLEPLFPNKVGFYE